MQNKKKTVNFLMGCNSPDGFYSFYNQLCVPKKGHRLFLIKGGSGTGKSGLMKKVAASFAPSDALTEYIHCSSDPNSLDGVILHSAKVSILDATPPHVVEPSYPGGFETVVNLCEYFNEPALEQKLEDFVSLSASNAALHQKCRKLLKCAHILQTDSARFIAANTDFEKIAKLASKISKKEFPDLKKEGAEQKRLLSAVTNQGYICYEDTVTALCDRIYLIKDPYGVSSAFLLDALKRELLIKGYDFFSCYSPLDPDSRIEHIIIPSLSLGFVTQNSSRRFVNITPYKTIAFTRFISKDALRARKQFLSFNRKMADQLILSASDVLKEAKLIHDKMESIYTPNVDFSGVDVKTAEVLSKIGARYDKAIL